MKLDVVCMKVGTGYKHEFVNQLFHQVKHQVNTFTCWTDNPRGFDQNIQVYEYKSFCLDRLWWNKVNLFEPGLFTNDTIYLDLDCYVHGQLKEFVDNGQILKTTWFSNDINKYIFNCDVNSSILYLKDNNFEEQYIDFQDNKEKVYKSFYGLDGWMYRRHRDKLKFFPSKLAYSYKYGSSFPDDLDEYKKRDNHVVACFDNVEDKEETLKQFWGD